MSGRVGTEMSGKAASVYSVSPVTKSRVPTGLSQSSHKLGSLLKSFCRRNPPKVNDELALSTLEGVGVRVQDEFGTTKVDRCTNNCNNEDVTKSENQVDILPERAWQQRQPPYDMNVQMRENKDPKPLTVEQQHYDSKLVQREPETKSQMSVCSTEAMPVENHQYHQSIDLIMTKDYRLYKQRQRKRKHFARKVYLMYLGMMLFATPWILLLYLHVPLRKLSTSSIPLRWVAYSIVLCFSFLMKIQWCSTHVFSNDNKIMSVVMILGVIPLLCVVTAILCAPHFDSLVLALVFSSILISMSILLANVVQADLTKRNMKWSLIAFHVILVFGAILWLVTSLLEYGRTTIGVAIFQSLCSCLVMSLELSYHAQRIQGTRSSRARKRDAIYESTALFFYSAWILHALATTITEMDKLRTSSPIPMI